MVYSRTRPEGLRAALPVWSFFAPPEVVGIVRDGFELVFSQGEPERARFSNHASAHEHAEAVSREIRDGIEDGVFVAWDDVKHRYPGSPATPYVVAPLGAVPKPEAGRVRVVHDLRHVNAAMGEETAAYESMWTLPLLCPPGGWAVKADLAAGYHHVGLHPSSWPWCGFSWEGRDFICTSLPFGLAAAPRVFMAVTGVAVSLARELGVVTSHLLDDFLVVASSRLRTTIDARIFFDILDAFGFRRHQVKTMRRAAQIVVFRGLIIDLVRGLWRVPPDKRDKYTRALQDAIRRGWCTEDQLEEMVGQLTFTSLAVTQMRQYTRGMYRALHICRDRPAGFRYTLSREDRADMALIIETLADDVGRPLWRAATRHVLTADACLTGGGGWLDFEGDPRRRVAWAWGPRERGLHINILEVRAVRFALASLEHLLVGSRVMVRTDNTVALASINKMGSRSPAVDAEVGLLWRWCQERDLDLFAEHIVGARNTLADALSRFGTQVEWVPEGETDARRVISRTTGPLWVRRGEDPLEVCQFVHDHGVAATLAVPFTWGALPWWWPLAPDRHVFAGAEGPVAWLRVEAGDGALGGRAGGTRLGGGVGGGEDGR
jgi:hypothetical protein